MLLTYFEILLIKLYKCIINILWSKETLSLIAKGTSMETIAVYPNPGSSNVMYEIILNPELLDKTNLTNILI